MVVESPPHPGSPHGGQDLSPGGLLCRPVPPRCGNALTLEAVGKWESSLEAGRAEQPGLISPGTDEGWKGGRVQQCVGWAGMPRRRKSDLLCRTACVGTRKMGTSSP